MQNWHSLYEILQFPIRVILFAVFLLGTGNLLVNDAFSMFISVDNQIVLLLAQAMIRLGTMVIVNYPLIFLIRLVTRRAGSATAIISAFLGYLSYLIMTMYFARTDLPSTAYSSILGISATTLSTTFVQGTVRYPLQTGVIAAGIVAVITLTCYRRSRYHSEFGLFGFISKDTWCVINTCILCAAAGTAVAYVWPLVIQAITYVIDFISSDTTNPINLSIYGIFDRFLTTLNLGSLIKAPFWYGTSGGSWISMSGISIAGDVNIWTNQLNASAISGMTGRFITPYYIVNIFAVPGMLWAIYSIHTDRLERRRLRGYYILFSIISIFMGGALPLEMTLFLLCPLLYLIHIGIVGILYSVFQSMHVYLGFNYTGTNTVAVMPGTLLEYLGYFRNASLYHSLIVVAIVGVICFFGYFLITRLYFQYLALDVFRTGGKQRFVDGTIEAVGGLDNIKLIHSSDTRLVISLYDPTKLNVDRLRELGSLRVYDTKAGHAITFGAASTIIRMGINEKLRNAVRSNNR